jgi:integrase
MALPEVAVKALRAYRTRQLQDRLLAGSRWQETGFGFTSTVGTPLDGRNVHDDFRAALKRAGLRAQRFHDLRHGAASLLLAQGVSARGVMKVLGHSQIGTTMNLYAHVMPEMLRDAAMRMDAVLGGERGLEPGFAARGCHLAVRSPREKRQPSQLPGRTGAPGRIRTCDPRIRSPML